MAVVVFENGKSGFLGEHSCMDGTPTLRLNEFILSSLRFNKVDHGPETVRGNIPSPAELKFELDGTVKNYIAEAEKHFDDLVGAHDLHVSAKYHLARRGPPADNDLCLGPTL